MSKPALVTRGWTHHWLPMAIATATAVGAIIVYQFDPTTLAWLPKCPVFQLLGWHCPGCGGTRAAHSLLHGDVGGAIANNALVVLLGPVLVAYAAWQRLRTGPDWAIAVPPKVILGLLAVMIVFAVLRNIPVYPLTLLAPH